MDDPPRVRRVPSHPPHSTRGRHHVTASRATHALFPFRLSISILATIHMPVSRKPPPSFPEDENIPSEGSSRQANTTPNEHIRRFTVTDDPAEPSISYDELAYNQIDEAVTLMQRRFPNGTSPTRPSVELPTSEPLSGSDLGLSAPPQNVMYRDNYASSQQTLHDQDPYPSQSRNIVEEEQRVLQGDEFTYHQPAPTIPTVDSGIPMQWELGDGQHNPNPFLDNPPHAYGEPNPFHDTVDPVPSHPHDGQEPMDAFQYDPERYGTYPRSSYPPLDMSRSPTPGPQNDYMVDEKDNSGYLDQQEGVPYGSEYSVESEKASQPDESPMDTKHFGPAPTGRVLRRHKTKKRVLLTEGNLVTDIDVPTQLVLPRKGEPEMMQTRFDAQCSSTI